MKKIFITILLITTTTIFARPSWHNWVQNLRQEAISQGINRHLFDSIFTNLTPNQKLLHLDRTQPETRLTYLKYRNTRGDAYRIKMGRNRYRRHRNLLNRIGNRYSVDPCFIVALWGLESSYGHFMGNFNVIRSLATLSYDGRRSAFFRKELLLALRMLNEGHISYAEFKGEWAGASGQSQFLPSSFFNFAVDFNADGRKDIWKTHADIFASIANYLHLNGWRRGEPILAKVTLPSNFNNNLISLKVKKPIYVWKHLGVRIKQGQKIPDINSMASILHPYGGPTIMIFNNFRTLMTWNYSSYYAGTVNYVAQRICCLKG